MESKFNVVLEKLKVARLDQDVLCSDFWRRILKLRSDFNETDCWALIAENMEWLINTGTMSTNDLKTWFTEVELNEHDIYVSGTVKIKDGFAIGLGNVKIEAAGHSRIVLFDTAFCEAYDTTFVTGFQDSSFVVTDCIGNAMQSCRAEAKGLSIIENWTGNEVKRGRDCLVVEREKS